jgi:hypothetical protein
MSCGRTIGHGETCQPDYLCGACERIAKLQTELAALREAALDYLREGGLAYREALRRAILQGK